MTEINEKQIFSIIQKSVESGKVKFGINEVTKSIERKQVKLVVYASDVSPKDIVLHLPGLCSEMDILCYEIGTKQELGSLLNVKATSALGIVDLGSASADFDSLKKESKPKKEEKKEEVKVEEKAEEKKEEPREESSKEAESEEKKEVVQEDNKD